MSFTLKVHKWGKCQKVYHQKLTTAGLPVGEDGGVEARYCALNHGGGRVGVYRAIILHRAVDPIKVPGFIRGLLDNFCGVRHHKGLP